MTHKEKKTIYKKIKKVDKKMQMETSQLEDYV